MSSIPLLPLDSHAVRYGLGVFETILVLNGKPIFYQEHIESIQKGADALGLPTCDFKNTDKERLNLAGDGIWRWFHTPSGLFHWFEKEVPPRPDSFELTTSRLHVSSYSWEARYKTMSYLLHLQARKEAGEAADKQTHQEALLLNENGIVASAAMANIFWVKNGIIYTPTHETGCREGVVRKWVIETSQKIGQNVQLTHAKLEELLAADEAWLTNSRIGITPINKIDSIEKKRGSITEKFQKLYDQNLNVQSL